MNRNTWLVASALVAGALAPAAMADGRKAGSTLLYPIHRSQLNEPSLDYWTVISVTNTNLDPVAGGTNAHFEYLNVIKDSNHDTVACFINNRTEYLSPADTLSVLTDCHNAADQVGGYLVISAEDPTQFASPWSFNHLVGSETVVSGSGIMFQINAVSFKSLVEDKGATDLDGDGELDFDGAEYEGVPDYLIIDNFIALIESSLILVNLTGGAAFEAHAAMDIWNDDEFPLSATLSFKCWFEKQLTDVSLVFSEPYLSMNTPNDGSELDLDCDPKNDELETGWARIRGVVANSQNVSIADPALLGAISAGVTSEIGGGHLLWESDEVQLNGDFYNFSAAGSDVL